MYSYPIWDYVFLFGIMFSYLGFCIPIRDYVFLFGIMYSYLGLCFLCGHNRIGFLRYLKNVNEFSHVMSQ